MAASIALYSSSPPSAVFSSAHGWPVLNGEIETSRRTCGQSSTAERGRGGLSSLFASGKGQAPHNLTGDTVDPSVSYPMSSFSCPGHLDTTLASAAVDGVSLKGACGISVPLASSLRGKDRGSFHPSRGHALRATASGEWGSSEDGGDSHGGQLRRRHSMCAERPSLGSVPALLDRPTSTVDCRRPIQQRHGFRLGSDDGLDSHPYTGSLDAGDVAVFDTQQSWNHIHSYTDSFCFPSPSEEDSSPFTPRGRYFNAGREGVFVGSASGVGLALERPESTKLDAAREQLNRLVGQPSSLETDRRPFTRRVPSPSKQDDRELLLEAQAQHELFCDALVIMAFNVAASAHQGQVRKDGKPYITHCLETALILVKCESDKDVVAAGLLHDILDDSMMGEEQLRKIIGDKVTDLVVGVSKLSKFSQLARDNETSITTEEAGRLRTMFLAMVDVRVVLIKLADRLHNLRTLEALPFVKQQRIARESLEIFAPLASRLGIWSWKVEIEDLCFKHLHPQAHKSLADKLEDGKRKGVVMASIKKLDGALKQAGVDFCDLSGRSKNLYSVYQKMTRKCRAVEDIFDVQGLRLIVADEAICYAALDVVHKLWTPSGGKHSKDYIKNPKLNGYQSLHTVVEGEGGLAMEVQIRTRDMHHQAEFGLAAHWQYKEGDAHYSAALRLKVAWARWVLSWQAELLDKKVRLGPADANLRPPCPFPNHAEGCRYDDSLGSVQLALQGSEADPLYVILLEDDGMAVQELSRGSTAADLMDECKTKLTRFANRVIRPLVNDSLVDATQILAMGDMVEIVVEEEEEVLEVDFPVLPRHAPGEDEFEMDGIVVEMERQRLKQVFRLEDGIRGVL